MELEDNFNNMHQDFAELEEEYEQEENENGFIEGEDIIDGYHEEL
jgi:hypothetical protein